MDFKVIKVIKYRCWRWMYWSLEVYGFNIEGFLYLYTHHSLHLAEMLTDRFQYWHRAARWPQHWGGLTTSYSIHSNTSDIFETNGPNYDDQWIAMRRIVSSLVGYVRAFTRFFLDEKGNKAVHGWNSNLMEISRLRSEGSRLYRSSDWSAFEARCLRRTTPFWDEVIIRGHSKGVY